jgi:hypothetical protein
LELTRSGWWDCDEIIGLCGASFGNDLVGIDQGRTVGLAPIGTPRVNKSR